ncbi:MAG: DNA-formamidopyrimidine glycosylase [Segetibacter sp.]|jgi:formamidopyrimidine-DNA glycosylase|nr:DNA-formamidopyrimidine glycosylase [Segetibacter sp.]
MPEAPDLQVFAKNLNKLFAGKQLQQVKVVDGKNLQDDESTLNAALRGTILKEVYRSGKELRFLFSNETVLGLHLMLHGKLFVFDESNENKHTIVELHFEGKGLAVTDYQKAANIKLNPIDKEGIDALSKELDFSYLKKALQSRTNIKSRITDQHVIRGVGNAYADEILWEAKIAPMSVSNKIPDEKIKALAKAIKSVLLNAEKEIEKDHPGIIAGEVRGFLKIHVAKKEKSPTGGIIKVDKKGGSTYYTDEQELFT